ncbi:MAG: SRPBCC domain-containing protein [Planctomycetota bacterium]
MATPTDPPVVTVERSFESPADVVWASLTRPEILAEWFRDGAQAEVRPGGVLRDTAGDAGEFLEVEEPRRLVLSWKRVEGDPARLVFEIGADGARTTLKVQLSALPSEKECVRQAEFWHWAIDSLESFLKSGFGIPYEPWREMQAELHRRAAVKSATEAAEERKEAGVVLAPLAEAPVMASASRPVTKKLPPKAPPKSKPAAKKNPAKRPAVKKPKARGAKRGRRPKR